MYMNMVFLFILGLISGSMVLAQEPPVSAERARLTVREALETAAKNNPGLNRMHQKIQAKAGEWWGGFGLPSPQVIFMKEGIDSGSHSGFTEKRWTVSQSLDFPLKSYFRLRRISTEQDALRHRLEAEYLALTAEVKRAYTEVAYTLKILRLRREELTIARQLHQTANTRVETGESSELESMKTEIQLLEAENDLSDARKAFHKARYQLFTVIGLDPLEQRYEIEFPDTLVYFETDIRQQEAMKKMTEQPRYRSISFELSAANWGVREAWSDFLPDLGLNIYRQDLGSGFDFYGFEIGFKVPLWFPLNQRSRIQIAKANWKEFFWEQQAVLLEVKQQIEDAWHAYEASKQTIDRYQQTIREQSRKLLDLTLEGYRLGELDILSLLESQRTYLNSQKRYYDSLRDYYLQLIEIEKFLGVNILFSGEE